VFENVVLRVIFGPHREELIGGWRKRNNEELHNLYFSLNIIRVTKSGKVSWAGHVTRMKEMSNAQEIVVGKPKG
jgi:hypothetical protein